MNLGKRWWISFFKEKCSFFLWKGFSLTISENLSSILPVDFFLKDETDAPLIPDMVIYVAGFLHEGKKVWLITINCDIPHG